MTQGGTVHSPLASPRATSERLKELGLYTKKSLGQHFLIDDNVIGRILALAEVQPDDAVLEVGPGIGTLTLALQTTGAQVTAIEYDEALVEPLRAITDPARVEVVHADAAKWLGTIGAQARQRILHTPRSISLRRATVSSTLTDELTCCASGSLPNSAKGSVKLSHCACTPTVLVANLPYQIAATVTLRAFETLPQLKSATVMVQREVAERMSARPGTKDYSGYTAKLRLLAKPAGRFEVARSCFLPPPNVDSTVIRLERIHPAPSVEAYTCTEALIGIAFAHRRKTLRNNLLAAYPAARIDEALAITGIDPRARAETLAPDQFIELADALGKPNKT